MEDLIKTSLNGFDIPIEKIIIDSHLEKDLAQLLKDLNLGDKIMVVADENTYEVYGESVFRSIPGRISKYIFGADILASLENVKLLREQIKEVDFIVAVGSGSINDICKYASYLEGRPYLVFPTAPSMNGYCSANASISVDGFKQSFKAHLPKAVFCDLNILMNAPIRLIRSGFGDSICRSTCQMDWLLSHYFLASPYNKEAFDLLLGIEKELLLAAKAINMKDKEAVSLLVKTLMLSGVGMYLSSGSYPASQGEHMIAHTIDMIYGFGDIYHGEQIAVTTLIMAGVQQKIIEQGRDGIDINNIRKDDVENFFGPKIGQNCYEEYCLKQKQITQSKQNINDVLLEVEKNYKKYSIGKDKLESCLKNIGAPTKIEEINVSEDMLSKALVYAKCSRNRFTFLDLL